MQDKTITSALLELRAQMIRGGLDGLDHVEALLLARGVDLQPARKPYRPRHGRNYARLLILEALRSGPMLSRAIADYAVAREPKVPKRSLRRLVSSALWKMGDAGTLVRDGGVWRLAQLRADRDVTPLYPSSAQIFQTLPMAASPHQWNQG